jgi:hypothetical protein
MLRRATLAVALALTCVAGCATDRVGAAHAGDRTVSSSPAAAAPAATPERPVAAAPGQPVFMVGDSLTFQASGSLDVLLAHDGWGARHISAGAGREVDYYVESVDTDTGLTAVDHLRRLYGDADHWIVALGTNDTLYADPSTYVGKIESMLDAIGPDRDVMWVNVYLPGVPDKQAIWNAALEGIASERGGRVVVFDWATINAAHPEWMQEDLVHHTDEGNVAFARAIAAASQMMRPSSSIDADPVSLDGASTRAGFVPVLPVRVLDTRQQPAASDVIRVPITNAAPKGSSAVALAVTAVSAGRDGFVTAHPCSAAAPPTSAVNFSTSGQPETATAIVPLDRDDDLCVTTSSPADVTVDVLGAFVPDAGSPMQLLESFSPRIDLDLGAGDIARVSLPHGATGAVVDLDALGADREGYITAWPCEAERPYISNLGFAPTSTTAGATIVPLFPSGNLCLFASAAATVSVGVRAVFGAPGSDWFHSVAPIRILDTRDGQGGWGGRLAPAQRIAVETSGPPAGAVLAGTVTATNTVAAGTIGSSGRTLVGFAHDSTTAGLLLAPLDADGALPLSQGADSRADVIADVTGWFAP